MGTVERRERQRRALREKILDAARELFTAFGYEGVTIREIAKKIEYSPTAIYLCFSDKDALLRELCSVDFLALGARFAALAAERDPVRRLRGIGAAYLRFARERPNHYRMMFMTPHPPVPVEGRRIDKGNPEQDAWALLKNTVADAQRAGLIDSDATGGETTAQLLFAGVHGVAALFITKANDPWIDWRPEAELAERMLDTLLRGCGYTGPLVAAPRRARAGRSAKSRSSASARAAAGQRK